MPTDPYAVLQALLRAEAARGHRSADPRPEPAPAPAPEPAPEAPGPRPRRDRPAR
ncbi:hypothetical protein [Streptomyces roseolus]|uniref:hypothetical protein n=1 Tax=Streptomyces roseolus TaxID=67358 RepID=UPI0016770230|nr:hypothetical protein [Streptomyces roseolus]GGR24681.1 hypothetical protein GCM10010282_16170 [Streptomyces roseolus]